MFDCDGTLVDSELLNNMAIIELLHSCGLRQYDLDFALHNFTGMRFSRIIEKVSRETGYEFPENAATFYLSKVAELSPRYLKCVEGAKDFVGHVSACSKICVVSNGERGNVLYSLEQTGLRKFFPDKHIITGLMAAPKPAPDLFLLALERFGENADCSLVIEDSTVGVRAARAADIDVWGFYGTHHAKQEHKVNLINAGACKTFASTSTMKAAFSGYALANNTRG